MWILRLIIELDMRAQVFLSGRYAYANILHKTSPSNGGQCIASASTLQRSIRDALASKGASRCDTATAVFWWAACWRSKLLLPASEFLANRDCGLQYSVQLVIAKVVIAPGFVTRESQGAFYSAPHHGVYPLPRSPQNRQTFSVHL